MNENYHKYLEQKIGWYKLVLSLFFVAASGSLGWYVNNPTASTSLRILAILGFSIFSVASIYCVSRTRNYIKKIIGEI